MMVDLHKKNPNSRRKSRLSRTKLLCAAGLTLCDFSTTDAAKAEGYLPDAKISPPYHNIHATPGNVLPTIDQNKTLSDLYADKETVSASVGLELDETSQQDPKLHSTLQRGTSRYPTTTNDPTSASESLPRNALGRDHLSDTPGRSINELPRPPPPQWIRDNRLEEPQTNNRQSGNRLDRRFTSEAMMPPNFNAHPNTRKNKRDESLNVPRNDQFPTPNYTTNARAQRRVPLHLQHATVQQRQNYYHTQPQIDISSKSNQAPRAFRSASPPISYDGNSQENFQNNRHARSYQSRIMQYHPDQQRSIPESNSNDYSKTRFEQPLNRDKWSRATITEDQHYNQMAASPNRSGIRSLRVDPMVNQYTTRGSTMNYRTKKSSENYFPSEMGQSMDDPNNSIISLVPRRSDSQLALVTPSLHEAILDNQINQVQSLVEAGAWLSFSSIQKISWCLLAISLLSYAAVSPSTLPLTEYNLQFYENFRLVCLSTIAPALYMLFVFDPRENDVNTVTNVFVVTFFFGYAGIYVLELIATTIVRLLLFVWLEPNVFSLTPKVPLPVLPWVLREWQYRPKRITLFAADFATSCVACPIIEECLKLFLLERICKLPRNFNWVEKSTNKRKAKRRVAEIIKREDGEYDCTSANQYVTSMLAISIAMKLADAARRILLYTKSTDANKGFYAICRGIFPIHELCGAMIAIALAKRDLLGVDMPRWKLLAPAIVVHAMANFRGKRPIFKWSASSPWSEMQLSPLNIPDSSTFLQLVKKGYTKLMWIITISRVFGYCVKNYYMVNRHALKRTTKYAGNHAAFSAELVTAESLKNLKK